MSEKKELTVTEGLGLESVFFKEAESIVKNNLKKYDTISEALAVTAGEVRNSELGEVNVSITAYERKLILAGFVMGCIRTAADATQKIQMLKMMMMLGGSEKTSLPPGMLDAILSDPDCPEELKNILRELGEDDD
jgi:hypothetical protein